MFSEYPYTGLDDDCIIASVYQRDCNAEQHNEHPVIILNIKTF